MIGGLPLLVQRHQQHVRAALRQHHVAAVPVAGVELDAEQRGDLLAQERLPDGELQRVEHRTQARHRAHARVGGEIGVGGIGGAERLTAGHITLSRAGISHYSWRNPEIDAPPIRIQSHSLP